MSIDADILDRLEKPQVNFGFANQPQAEKWLDKHFFNVTNIENVVATTISDNSMAPTFNELDQVYIDTGINKLGEGVFCFLFENQLFFRRVTLQRRIYLISSDNCEYPSWELERSRASEVRVIGKVKTVFRAESLL